MFRDDDVLKPFEQMSQMCGFSPVWVLRCLVNSEGRSNSLPQCSQGNIVLFLIFLAIIVDISYSLCLHAHLRQLRIIIIYVSDVRCSGEVCVCVCVLLVF